MDSNHVGYGQESFDDDVQLRTNAGSSVFVTNLQWWTSDVDLEAVCSEFGTVSNIKFIEDKACGKSRGMAVIDFAEPEAAEACIASLAGRDIHGRPCKVQPQQQYQHIQQQQQQQQQQQHMMMNQANSRMMMPGGRGPGRGRGRGRGPPMMDSMMGMMPPPMMMPGMMMPPPMMMGGQLMPPGMGMGRGGME